jgi:ABC-type spermidine/putrescine transport system permease subunit II
MDQLTQEKNIWTRLGGIVYRVAVIALIAFVIGFVLNTIAANLQRGDRPANFFRGMVQGALMPMSMPNLVVGKDVNIYSVNNTGITYKLGYTLGTNTCGALFFGVFFWRIRRWRAGNEKR